MTHDLLCFPSPSRITAPANGEGKLSSLRSDLRLPPRPVAEQEACFIEHDVSAATVDRMLKLILEKRDNPALQSIVAGLEASPPTRRRDEPCPTCGTECIGPELGD